MRILRFCLQTPVFSSDHWSTEDVLGFLPCFPAMVVRVMLAAIGHWIRDHHIRGREHVFVDVLEGWPHNNRRGAPRRIDSSILLLTACDMNLDVMQLALDRSKWRAHVDGVFLDVSRSVFNRVLAKRRYCTDEDAHRALRRSMPALLRG